MNNKLSIPVIIIIVFILLIIVGNSFAYIDVLCGPRSLLFICNKLDIQTDLDELCNLSGYDKETGTTFLGLYKAAQAKGLPAIAFTMEYEDLCKLDSYSIAFVDERHFLVVVSCKEDSLTVIDPPEMPETLSKERFCNRWKGEILCFSDSLKKAYSKSMTQRKSIKGGPSIKFDHISHDFGVTETGKLLSHTFDFVNMGTEDLEVYSRTSCGCTSALLSDKLISPGSTGNVQVEFNTLGRGKGKKIQTVYLRSNDIHNKILKLTVKAILKGKVDFAPDRLWLGNINVNNVVEREVLVADPGDGSLKIENIESGKDISAEVCPDRTVDDHRVIPVLLKINVGNKGGAFESSVTIRTNDEHNREKVIPIKGTVITKLVAVPSKIIFGDIQPGTSAIQEIILRSTSNEPIDISGLQSSLSFIETNVTPYDNNTKFKLAVSMKSPPFEITLREPIKVYVTNEEDPVLEIPFFAKVINNNE